MLGGDGRGAGLSATGAELVLPAAASPATANPRRVRLLGLELDVVTEAEAISIILRSLDAGQGGFVVTPNLDHLRQLSRNKELAALFRKPDLVVADGMPLVWASRLQGTPLPERVAGSELIWSLTAEAGLRGKSVFLLGGAPGAGERAGEGAGVCLPPARPPGDPTPPPPVVHAPAG